MNGLLTFAKVYGIKNTAAGREQAKQMAEWIAEDIREKFGTRVVGESAILFDDRLADRPGFRLKVECRSSNALAEYLNLPKVEGRRGRTVGGRDAVVIDLRGEEKPATKRATMALLPAEFRKAVSTKASASVTAHTTDLTPAQPAPVAPAAPAPEAQPTSVGAAAAAAEAPQG